MYTPNSRRKLRIRCSIPDRIWLANRGFYMGRLCSAMVACAAVVLVVVGAPPAVAAQSDGSVTMSVSLNGTNISGHTVAIDPSRSVGLAITVTNNTASTANVHSVRLSGTALALTFFE